MALILLMSDFDGKSAHVLEEESVKKIIELELELSPTVLFFPESAVHPQFQMDIADKYLLQREDTIIVTHSENILLRSLRRIRNKDICSSDLKLFILRAYVNKPEKGFYWKDILIDDEGEIIDNLPGGFFEQGYRERFDIGDIPRLQDISLFND